MSMARFCAVSLVLVGCQKSPAPFEGAGQEYGQPGTDGYPAPTTAAPGTDGFGDADRPTASERMTRPDVPRAVEDLRRYVDELRGMRALSYTDLATALRDLASAFQTLPAAGPAITDAVSRIESYADRIEAAGATSDMHARWVSRALAESIDALEAYQQERAFTGMTDRILDLRDQVDNINPDQPFADQKDAFVDTLERVTDVLVDVSAPRRQQGTQ